MSPENLTSVNPHHCGIKDAGIAIRHSRGRILLYTAGSGKGLEGVKQCVRGDKNKWTLQKNIFLLYQ